MYEKEHKLRQGMRMMGLRGSIYWAAWFIHSQIINILSTLLLIAAGMACDFAFFRYTNFFVLFLVFWVFAWTMSHLAFLIATLIPTTKLAVRSSTLPHTRTHARAFRCGRVINTAHAHAQVYMSMFVFIIGALLMLIFSLFGAFMFPLYVDRSLSFTIYLFCSSLTFSPLASRHGRTRLYEGGPIATPALWVLSFVPMYNFAKAVFDINNKSFSLGSVTGEGTHPAGLLSKATWLNLAAVLWCVRVCLRAS